MAGSQREGEPQRRITREEMFPTVGDSTDALKALIPTFTERLIDGVVDALRNGGVQRVELQLTSTGDNSQTLRVNIDREGEGGLLAVRLAGDWQDKPNVPTGLPVIAEHEGKFWRYIKPGEPDPIAEVGNILAPRDAFGLATRGKNDRWFLRLSPEKFPNGGRITAFTQANGADVEKGKTTLLFVEPV